jgi:hypothetical protein
VQEKPGPDKPLLREGNEDEAVQVQHDALRAGGEPSAPRRKLPECGRRHHQFWAPCELTYKKQGVRTIRTRTIRPQKQGCQIVYFQPQNPNLVIFLEGLRLENFDIFYGHLEYFLDIGDIL